MEKVIAESTVGQDDEIRGLEKSNDEDPLVGSVRFLIADLRSYDFTSCSVRKQRPADEFTICCTSREGGGVGVVGCNGLRSKKEM